MINRILNAKILPIERVNAFIIGTQKGGTSSLYDILLKSKDVGGSIQKEVMFFSHQENYMRGFDWYHTQLKQPLISVLNPPKVLLDATPEYMFYEMCAERIHDYNKNAKLVFVLRNPVDRAYSHWNMYRQFYNSLSDDDNWLFQRHFDLLEKNLAENLKKLFEMKEWPSFEEAIAIELETKDSQEPSFLARGRYDEQIKRYLQFFEKEKIYVDFSETLKSNKSEFVRRVSNFLDIEIEHKQSFKDTHQRSYASKMKSSTRTKLNQYFEKSNERLEKLIERPLPW